MWWLREGGDPVDVVKMIITPELGRHKEIGRLLLDLAEHPHEVQWVTWPNAGFQVSLELFEKFEAAGQAPAAVDKTEPAVPVAKKRGRPRKNPQSAGDNTSKEE